MSRATKWKLENTKVKVVFRLQFHATHVPQSGWDKLFITFISADSGKATAKTTKANVRNGTCKWADPIYETTRLLQDVKSKQYEEKFYKLVVSMGSSRSTILGEATVNLAEYADAFKPSIISLPLYGCDSGTTLHVTVQVLTSKTGFREFEQQRELRERGLQSDQSNPDEYSRGKLFIHEDVIRNQDSTKIRFKDKFKELASNEEELGFSEESAAGFDASSNTSGSQYTEKHETDRLKSTGSGDFSSYNANPGHHLEKGEISDPRFSAQGTGDWVRRWTSESSADSGHAATYEENVRLRGSLGAAESSIAELRGMIDSLQNYADEISNEAQKLSSQLAAEITSGLELAEEVTTLKSESSKLNAELERFKASKPCQIGWLNGLYVLEDKLMDIRDKSSLGYHERDFRFPHSDIEAAVGILQNLTQGFAAGASEKPSLNDGCQLVDSVESASAMKGKIFELLREAEESKNESISLKTKMDQMECYYEGLVQELEDNQKQLITELQNLKNDHSTSLYMASSTKAEMEAICINLNEQILQLTEDKCDLMSLNEKLEKRATSAEAALKRARLNYSIAVGHLQKDLELLSSQILSMFETSESLVRQAFLEIEPAAQNREEKLKSDGDVTVVSQLQNHFHATKKSEAGDIFLDDLKKSFVLQEEVYKKVDEELCEVHFVNMYLNVHSKILEETLLQSGNHHRLVNDKYVKLMQQLTHSNGVKELLKKKLITAEEEILFLNEYIVKSNEVVQQKQILESDIQNLNHENSILLQRVKEYEQVIMHCSVYQSKFEDLVEEKAQLSYLLENETVINGELRNEILNLCEELKKAKDEYHVLQSGGKKLRNLVASYADDVSCSEDPTSLELLDCLDFLETHHQNSKQRITQLAEDKEKLLREKDSAVMQSSSIESEKSSLKLRFKYEIESMMDTLQRSNALVQKLDNDIEAITEKLGLTIDFEQNYLQVCQELFSNLSFLEDELLKITDDDGAIRQDVCVLKSLAEQSATHAKQKDAHTEKLTSELTTLKDDFVCLSEEKQALQVSLMAKMEETSELSKELSCVKECLQSLRDEKNALVESLRARGESSELEAEFNAVQGRCENLQAENKALIMSLQESEEEAFKMASELSCLTVSFAVFREEKTKEAEKLWAEFHSVKDEHKSLTVRSRERSDEFSALEKELKNCVLRKSEEAESFAAEIQALKDELVREKSLSAQSMRKAEELTELSKQYESVIPNINLKKEECSSDLETHLFHLHELLVAADVKLSFLTAACAGKVEELADKNTECTQENARLMTSLSSMESDHRDFTNSISDADFDELLVCNAEREIKMTLLEEQLAEQREMIESLQEFRESFAALQAQYEGVNRRLSEQTLKTEEFRSLSRRFKELSDKNTPQPDPEKPRAPASGGESLRIAFMKEQHETKLQEMTQQVAVSKQHSEEMLLKLQDTLNEIESRKKSEAFLMKKNEELGMHILDLEAELQTILSDKREKTSAYDMIKAEMECSLISLECCKEENTKLEAAYQEILRQNSEIKAELSLAKGKEATLADMGSQTEISERRCDARVEEKDFSSRTEELSRALKDMIASVSQNDHRALQNGDAKHLSITELKSSMDHLNDELERMKNENLGIDEDAREREEKYPEFRDELLHLRKANEELRAVFPLLGDSRSGSSALRRVLALEMELAESLQSRKRPGARLHSEEETMVKSFRDINDLIGETLAVKESYSSVEKELREMQERYSQLSLKFAEVEGERQKLMMSLKNARTTPKKLSFLSRTLSGSPEENSS